MSYKKIKNMTAAILLGCAVLSQSCTSWLDITPEAQVNDKKIFSTPQGFKDVLNGIYITASGEKLYANNLLFGFTDVLAQYYAIPDETHEFAQLAKYQYKDVNISPKIDEMWNCISVLPIVIFYWKDWRKSVRIFLRMSVLIIFYMEKPGL